MGVGAGLHMYDVVVKTFTFAISSTDEFLYNYHNKQVKNIVYKLPGKVSRTIALYNVCDTHL